VNVCYTFTRVAVFLYIYNQLHVDDLMNVKGATEKSVDSLAYETLIPKTIVQRYVSLLVEHRRIILCGPSGTGKTFLAQRLAEYLVLRYEKVLLIVF